MSQRYTIHFHGLTSITSDPNGSWPRWEPARADCIEHLESQVRECLLTLCALRRAWSFGEYKMLMGEVAGSEDSELAQVQVGGTLTCKWG